MWRTRLLDCVLLLVFLATLNSGYLRSTLSRRPSYPVANQLVDEHGRSSSVARGGPQRRGDADSAPPSIPPLPSTSPPRRSGVTPPSRRAPPPPTPDDLSSSTVALRYKRDTAPTAPPIIRLPAGIAQEQLRRSVALQAWANGSTVPYAPASAPEVPSRAEDSWRPSEGCEDLWALRHPRDVMNPAGRSCAWARLRRACDAVQYECNSTCAGCRAGTPKIESGRPFSSLPRILRLQVLSIRSSARLRQRTSSRGIQLAEVYLYSGRRRLKVKGVRILNADGTVVESTDPQYDAAKLVDGNHETKWADMAPFGSGRTVELELAKPQLVTGYELIAANDHPELDPISWVLWAVEETTGALGLVNRQQPYSRRLPRRLASYGRLGGKASGREVDMAAPLTPRVCGSIAAPATYSLASCWRAPSDVGHEARDGGQKSDWLVKLFDSSGESELPSLERFEGKLWALEAAEGVASVIIYEHPAFAGVRLQEAQPAQPHRCTLPASARGMAMSIRVQLCQDGVATLMSDVQAPGRRHLAVRSRVVFGDVSEMVDNAEESTTRDSVEALCLGAGVSGALVYPLPGFGGQPTLLWRSTSLTQPRRPTGSPEEADLPCLHVTFQVRSMRVVGDRHAVLLSRDGSKSLLRDASPQLTLGGGLWADTLSEDGQRLAGVCLGRSLRAIEVFSSSVWQGESIVLRESKRCPNTIRSFPFQNKPCSIRLHLISQTVEINGVSPLASRSVVSKEGIDSRHANPGTRRSHVILKDSPGLPSLEFTPEVLYYGASLRGVVVFAQKNFKGKRLRLPTEHSVPQTCAVEQCRTDVPVRWHGKVKSMLLLSRCDFARAHCTEQGTSWDAHDFHIEELDISIGGQVLPLRFPDSLPFGMPKSLMSNSHGDFRAFNPSFIQFVHGDLQIAVRVSNYNFCNNKLSFQQQLRDAHGAIMSFVARVQVDASSWSLRISNDSPEPKLSLWRDVNALFPTAADQILSGGEDPRGIMTSSAFEFGTTPLLFVAVWESPDVQWLHLVRNTSSPHDSKSMGSVKDRIDELHDARQGVEEQPQSEMDASGFSQLTSVPLEVHAAFEPHLQLWLPQFRTMRSMRTREKNWVPFEWGGSVYLEYSLEPRLVLSLNAETGISAPLLPITSSPDVAHWIDVLGPVSGGAQSVYVPQYGVFLGMAHVKLFKKKGPRTATSHMMYKHFWYTFEPRPPFRVLSVSSPFSLPSQLPSTPSIQFAAGMLVIPEKREVVVAYGERDCFGTLARFPLGSTIERAQELMGIILTSFTCGTVTCYSSGTNLHSAAHLRELLASADSLNAEARREVCSLLCSQLDLIVLCFCDRTFPEKSVDVNSIQGSLFLQTAYYPLLKPKVVQFVPVTQMDKWFGIAVNCLVRHLLPNSALKLSVCTRCDARRGP
ncbi:hypothetical protein AB1Y20_020782 [Prymnesium parvum]|uniref:CST complex subunit CTC1 n=1 Tax=Prymnesium parvum TaxID=97485 RepID=A0AB34JYG5_PRYPA